MIYHVCKRWDGCDLESMCERYGEMDAHKRFARRWPDADALAACHIEYIHCWATLSEAKEYARGQRAQVLAIDDDNLDVHIDTMEFAHPMVRDRIPAELIHKVA